MMMVERVIVETEKEKEQDSQENTETKFEWFSVSI